MKTIQYIKPSASLNAKPTVVQQFPLNAFPVQELPEIDLGTFPSGTTPSGNGVSQKPEESPMTEKIKKLWTKTKSTLKTIFNNPVTYVIIIIGGVAYYFYNKNKY